MTKEEIIKYQIKAQYGNTKRFCEQTGIPYSTVRNIFSRGFDGIGVLTAVKICKALNLDIERLMDGQFLFRPDLQKDAVWAEYANQTPSSYAFTDDDMAILAFFQTLNQDQKSLLLSVLKELSGQATQGPASPAPGSSGEGQE